MNTVKNYLLLIQITKIYILFVPKKKSHEKYGLYTTNFNCNVNIKHRSLGNKLYYIIFITMKKKSKELETFKYQLPIYLYKKNE